MVGKPTRKLSEALKYRREWIAEEPLSRLSIDRKWKDGDKGLVQCGVVSQAAGPRVAY